MCAVMNDSSASTSAAISWVSGLVCRSVACLARTRAGRSQSGAIEPADPQPGRHDLRHRAERDDQVRRAVDRSSGQGPQAGERLAPEAERAVGVVLDQHEAEAVGQLEQPMPAIEREGRARRVLEVGHDVDDLRWRAGRLEARRARRSRSVDAEAVGVGGHADESGARGLERLQRPEVPGRLDHDDVAGIAQRPGQQVEPLLRAGRDQHVVGVDGAVGPSRPATISRRSAMPSVGAYCRARGP